MPSKVPPKAILLENLVDSKTKKNVSLKTTSNLSPNHTIIPCEYEDGDEIVEGFFKVIDADYPELSAKYCVDIAILGRILLAEDVAEERLVLDGKIVRGTFSRKLEDFQPLECYSPFETPVSMTNPSVEMLLEYNAAAKLEFWWRIRNDDGWPGNFGLRALYDWDMARYYINCFFKGMRKVNGILTALPYKSFKLKEIDIIEFPFVKDPNFWVTYTIPGNGNIAKTYKSAQSFCKLIKNPSFTKDGKTVTFQEQFFSALLKDLLLSHDPVMLESRLKEYFGNLPLNYTEGVSESKLKKLAECDSLKELFNAKTNSETYVSHALKVANKEFQDLYRAVTFCQGSKANSADVPVPSFRSFLMAKPSAYHEAVAYAKEQNQKENWTLKTSKFNLEKIQLRYFGIWRDAHLFKLNLLIRDFRLNVIEDVAKRIRIQLEINNPPPDEPIEETSITEIEDLLEGTLRCEKRSYDACANKMKSSLGKMITLYNVLIGLAAEHGKKPYVDLSEREAQVFTAKLQEAITIATESIGTSLGPVTSYHKNFNNFIKKIEAFCLTYNLKEHMKKEKDSDLYTSKEDIENYVDLDHTQKAVMDECLRLLFSWVDSIHEKDGEESVLKNHLLNAVAIYSMETRQSLRAEKVQNFIKGEGRKHSGSDLLGYILSEGEHKSNSLNTTIITNLFCEMIEKKSMVKNPLLYCINNAINSGTFRAVQYAKAATEKAKTDPNLKHFYSASFAQTLNQTMYDWVDKLSPETFNTLLDDGQKTYHSASVKSMFGFGRTTEVKSKGFPMKHSEHLASLYITGKQSSSLSTEVFTRILLKMQEQYRLKEKAARKNVLSENERDVYYIKPEHINHFTSSLIFYAGEKMKQINSQRVKERSNEKQEAREYMP